MINPRISNPPPVTPRYRIILKDLYEFTAAQIVLNKAEAWCVLAYFFDHPGVHAKDLTENDLSFAQALLLEAIDQSYFANIMLSNYPIYLSREITKVVVTVLKKTGGQWSLGAAHEYLLEHPELNAHVRTALTNAYIWNWITRVRAGVRAYSGVPAT